MKTVATISRILLGAVFLLSGLNGFVRLHGEPSFGTALARTYMAVMQATQYAHVLFAIQLLCGVLLLADLFVPLALTVLAAFMVNIALFHIFLDPGRRLPVLVLITALWIVTYLRYKDAFKPLLLARMLAS